MCDSKILRIIKLQEASGLLSNLVIRNLLSKLPPLVNILFWRVLTC